MTTVLGIARCSIACCFLLGVSGLLLQAQQQQPSHGWTVFHEGGTISDASAPPPVFTKTPADPKQAQLAREMAREREAQRQKQILADTDRLFDLAKQLKDTVDKSSQDQLSLEALKTASQIEKLAKSVKQKMRESD